MYAASADGSVRFFGVVGMCVVYVIYLYLGNILVRCHDDPVCTITDKNCKLTSSSSKNRG